MVKKLERDLPFHAYYFNPTNGRKFDLGTFVCVGAPPKPVTNQEGAAPVQPERKDAAPVVVWSDDFQAPAVPSPQDWVLVLERLKPGTAPREYR